MMIYKSGNLLVVLLNKTSEEGFHSGSHIVTQDMILVSDKSCDEYRVWEYKGMSTWMWTSLFLWQKLRKSEDDRLKNGIFQPAICTLQSTPFLGKRATSCQTERKRW